MFTPNVITLLGQVPNLILLFIVFRDVGMTMNGTVLPDYTYFYWMAAATQWASQFDIMDGIRARRLRAGSPVGRLVDEAFDMVCITCYCLWIGYGLQMNNCVLEVMMLMVTMTVFCMELKFVMCKNLLMIVGELGPVENEIILTLVIVSCGYFTPEFYQQPVSSSFESLKDNELAQNLPWGYVGGAIFLPM